MNIKFDPFYRLLGELLVQWDPKAVHCATDNTETMVQWDPLVNLIVNETCWLPEPLSIPDLTVSLLQLKSLSSVELALELQELDKNPNNDFVAILDKPIGYKIRCKLPNGDQNWEFPTTPILKDDFITQSVNPVICIPADFNPHGGLAKAFMREFKPQQELFNQKARPGQVAILSPSVSGQSFYIFFCVTRPTAKHEIVPELFYKCLWDLKSKATKLGLSCLSFPLLDWDRGFSAVNDMRRLMHHVFNDSDLQTFLYSYYFLSIK